VRKVVGSDLWCPSASSLECDLCEHVSGSLILFAAERGARILPCRAALAIIMDVNNSANAAWNGLRMGWVAVEFIEGIVNRSLGGLYLGHRHPRFLGLHEGLAGLVGLVGP